MRCHDPHYALRVKQQGQQLLDASLCFHCFNVRLFVGVDRIRAYFDADSVPAKDLLRAIQQLDPDSSADDADNV